MATIKVYPYKPDGSVDTSIELDVTTYTADPLLASEGGGYYITRHTRVPMQEKVGLENRHVAVFPKTIATQVLETTTKAFVTESSRGTLEKLAVVDSPSEGDTSKHLSINGVMQPSYYEIDSIQSQVSTLSSNQSTFETSLSNHEGRIGTLEDYFDGAIDADTVINKWHEIEDFLNGITESDTLSNLISSAISNLKSGTNTWAGTNTWTGVNNKFTQSLRVASLSTPGYVEIGELDVTTTFEMGKISLLNGTTDTTLYIPTSEGNSLSGTIALTKDIPYIGFAPPTTPKAGDMWFSA